MGSCFNTYQSHLQEGELEQYHDEYQNELRIELGCDTYAGHLGILSDGLNVVKVKPFKSSTEAEEYLSEHHNKWNQAMAVPFRGRAMVLDGSSRKLVKARGKAEKELLALERKIVKSIRNAKSKTIKCKSCDSTVARKHLSSANCPVCGMSKIFLSNTHRKQLKRKVEKLSLLMNQKTNKVARNTTCYLVGGWCPE
jgi:predicted RNA-binding Zn-ribbon protein involved in translation (DUF1610 family)